MSGAGTPDSVPDPRPKPQYGEYATPQEVANARGIPLDRSNEHVERLAVPLPVPPATNVPPATKKPTSLKSSSPAPGPRSSPSPAGRSLLAQRPGQVSPLVTVLLLVFGIWNTVMAIPAFLDLGTTLTQAFAVLGYNSAVFGSAAHVTGIVLLVFSFLLLISAVGLSLRRIRAGRSSFWVPLAAGGIWVLGYLIAILLVVANTPGITAVLQNHS